MGRSTSMVVGTIALLAGGYATPVDVPTRSAGMGVQVHKHFFDAREEVFDDFKKTGFWPTTIVSGPGPGVVPLRVEIQ